MKIFGRRRNPDAKKAGATFGAAVLGAIAAFGAGWGLAKLVTRGTVPAKYLPGVTVGAGALGALGLGALGYEKIGAAVGGALGLAGAPALYEQIKAYVTPPARPNQGAMPGGSGLPAGNRVNYGYGAQRAAVR